MREVNLLGQNVNAWRGENYDGTTGSFDYKQIGAYNGGSSLAIYGDLEAGKKQTVNLYKTDLQVLEGSKLSLTYNKISDNDLSDLALVLRFKG